MTTLTDEEAVSVAQACGSALSFAAGTDIAPQGDRPSGFHIIVEGWAARYKVLPNGRRQFPGLFLPGDICDLDGLLLQRVHSGVSALTGCKVVVLPHGRIRALMDNSSAIRDAFWWFQSVENAIATEWTVGLGRRSAEEKVAHLLCELLIRLRTAGLSVADGYAFPLTQSEIGDALGLSTVHVNRTMTDLRGQGLIEIRSRWLRIFDVEALMKTGCFDPDYLHLEGVKRSLGADQPAGVLRLASTDHRTVTG
ncbi:MAG: Crp/Fnr family transcriptional regulator [Janthinobacterium lividum]